jgi:hypothetical protein
MKYPCGLYEFCAQTIPIALTAIKDAQLMFADSKEFRGNKQREGAFFRI